MDKVTGQEFLNIKSDELTPESRIIYDTVVTRNFGLTYLTPFDINKIKMVIEENFKIKSGGFSDPDYQMQAEALTYILNRIIVQRNNIINSKKIEFGVQNELECLKRSCETLIEEYKKLSEMHHYKGIRIPSQLLSQHEIISKKATEIVNILDSDIKHFKKFAQEYNKIKQDFEVKKAKYERKSTFGKILAKFNGQEKAYNESRKQVLEYENIDVKTINKIDVMKQASTEYQFQALENPHKYQEIINETTQNETSRQR